MLATAWPGSKLKYQLERMVAGGTPSTDTDQYWTDSGVPWIAIADMTGREVVTSSAKSVTEDGIKAARLEVLPEGTLLFAMYASLGTTAFLGTEATTNQAILGLVPRSGISNRFVRYWLQALHPHLRAYSRSNTQDNLNAEVVGNLPFPALSGLRQRAIADFLDRETGRIDALVEKKRRLIDLLEEKRTALISHVVTKGLDPTVPMKDSGIPAMPVIPKHWDTSPVWMLFERGRGRVISHEEIDENPGEYPVYSSQTADDGVLGHLATFDFEGDYLTWTTDGARAGTVFNRTGRFNCTNVCGTLKAKKPSLDLRYFHHALNLATKPFVRTADVNPKLMNGPMGSIRIPVPDEESQTGIADYIENYSESIEVLGFKLAGQLELLAEYRQALITAAVTGQIDAGSAAPQPEEAMA